MKARKKLPRPRTRTKRKRVELPKPHKLAGRKLDNRELQDLVEALGMRLVPKADLTPREEIENRLHQYLTIAQEAFTAAKDAAFEIKQLGSTIVPLMNELRTKLGQHENRLDLTDASLVDHGRRIGEHTAAIAEHERRLSELHTHLTALEERTKGI